MLGLTWVFEDHCSSDFGDCHISCSGEQMNEGYGSLSEQLRSQLSGQSVNYYLKTILLFVSGGLEEKFHGLRAEWSAVADSHRHCCVVWGWERAVGGYEVAKGRKCKGSGTCLRLSELTLNRRHHGNQVSWRTGSWVEERLWRDYI